MTRRPVVRGPLQRWRDALFIVTLHAIPAAAVMRGIEHALAEGPRTPDLGGKATTAELGKAIAELIV